MAYLREKMNNISFSWALFIAIVFILPIQTRIVHFYPESHLAHEYIFYNTLFLHLTDIIIVLSLLFLLKGKFAMKHQNKKVLQVIFLFFLLCLFSVLVSRETNIAISYFGLFKLFISIGLFCFILNLVSVKHVKQIFYILVWLILAISLFEALIGILQYFSQHSVGLSILGEEYLKASLDGVARFKTLDGRLWIFDNIFNVSRETFIMRPYGTFPHPNVFGAFMGFSAIFTYFLYLVSHGTVRKVLLGCAISIQIFTLILSFSRVAILGWFLGTILLYVFYTPKILEWVKRIFRINKVFFSSSLHQIKRKNLISLGLIIICTLIFCSIVFYSQFLERGGLVSYGTTNQEAIGDRLLYQKIALEMIKTRPLTGVGFQNFVMAMDEYSPIRLKPYQHQPVHNIYLLVAAETGILGFLIFITFILLVLKSAFTGEFNYLKAAAFSIFICFLFIGFFDHYILTIQQGRFMFFLTAGFLVARGLGETENKKTSLLSNN